MSNVPSADKLPTVPPESVKLITDPAHFLYDERAEESSPLKEGFVANIDAIGVQTPALLWRDPKSGEFQAVDGTQRIRALRIVNAERAKTGARPPLELPYTEVDPSMPPEQVMGMKVSLNMQRLTETPSVLSKKLIRLKDAGMPQSSLPTITGKSESEVHQHFLLSKCTPDIVRAVDEGKMSVSAAAKLAALAPEKQAELKGVLDAKAAETGGVITTQAARDALKDAGIAKPRDTSGMWKPGKPPSKAVLEKLQKAGCLTNEEEAAFSFVLEGDLGYLKCGEEVAMNALNLKKPEPKLSKEEKARALEAAAKLKAAEEKAAAAADKNKANNVKPPPPAAKPPKKDKPKK